MSILRLVLPDRQRAVQTRGQDFRYRLRSYMTRNRRRDGPFRCRRRGARPMIVAVDQLSAALVCGRAIQVVPPERTPRRLVLDLLLRSRCVREGGRCRRARPHRLATVRTVTPLRRPTPVMSRQGTAGRKLAAWPSLRSPFGIWSGALVHWRTLIRLPIRGAVAMTRLTRPRVGPRSYAPRSRLLIAAFGPAGRPADRLSRPGLRRLQRSSRSLQLPRSDGVSVANHGVEAWTAVRCGGVLMLLGSPWYILFTSRRRDAIPVD